MQQWKLSSIAKNGAVWSSMYTRFYMTPIVRELSVVHQYFISITCACLRILLEIHTPIYFFLWFSVILRCNKRETCVICLLFHQWKVVDERYSGNVFTDDHWYSTHIPRIVRVRTTQTTQKIRKTAQYCANFYAKLSFELLKTWNRVKHRYGEHRRTTAEVPRQKNWWNSQIADVSRNAPVPLTGDATALARRTKKK